MKKKNIEVKKIFFLLVLAFFLVFFSFSVYTVLSGIISFGELEKWDGKTVADAFTSGNGTKENPYVIHDAAEFMYFKSLIEGDSYKAYQDKYYELDANIDFNNNSIKPVGVILKKDVASNPVVSNSDEVVTEENTEEVVKEEVESTATTEENEERIFKGVFDGKGYSLMNFKMEEASVIEDTSYFALFSKIDEGKIYHLNLDNYKIEVPESNDVVISGLVGNINKGLLENVSLRDFNIKVKKSNSITIGLIAGESDEETEFKKIYLNGEVDDINEGIVRYFDKGKDSIIISNIKYNGTILSNNLKELYTEDNGLFYLNGEEVSIDDLIDLLNQDLETDYYWNFENNLLSILTHKLDVVEIPKDSQGFSFSIQKAGDISIHDDGFAGTSVYINDLDSDLNYYNGLNYTKINNTNGTIPDGTNMGLYSNSNLATVYIRYSSSDINNPSLAGRVSANDNYTDFYYYKRMPVVNGYIEFDLIDSPWGYRPNNMAFNGWVTDYSGAVVSLDMDTYTRSVRVPVSDVSSVISITFYSSWTEATTVTTTGDLGSLKNIGMTALSPSYSDTFTDYFVVDHVNRYYYYPDLNNIYTTGGTHIEGGSYCNTSGGCDYLTRNTNANYESGTTYYRLTPIEDSENVTVTTVTPTIASPIDYYSSGISAGYFKRVTSGSDNIYSATGEKLSSCSGTCYQLMQYSDGALDPATTYYYLTTRDTNIFAPSNDTTNTNNISTNRPMTITGINNGNNNSNNRTIYLNNNWTINNDLRVEYIRFYVYETDTNVDSFDASGYKIIGNFKNVKLGRGLGRNGTYLTATSFVAGSSSSTSDVQNYHMIVESGYYQNGSGTGFVDNSGWFSTTPTHRVKGLVTLGSDFDRIRTDGNDSLIVYYCYAGSWGSNLYNSSSSTDTYDFPAISTVVKSGSFGTNEADYAAGIYAGGRNSGSHYSLREVTVEGGYIFNLIGGPVSSSARAGKNDIVMNVKDGTINLIFGGAGASNTVGNRIINVTGGKIQLSILGGSNAYTTGSSDPYGKIDGDTLLYVGGSVEVGTESGSLYNISSGNVFGAGNGRDGELDVGSVNNSNVIIGPTAKIKGSVYGGGNFGAVGGNITGNSSYDGGDPPSEDSNDPLLYEDGTVDNNIRYYGDSPHNYIRLGNDTYRIVGLFNNVNTPNGSQNLVRVVRNTSSNNAVAWLDNYITSGTNRIYANYFVRDDNDAKSNMYNYLNTTFYNGLNNTVRGYIQTATWNMGATASEDHTAGEFYTAERGNTPGSNYSVTSYSSNVGLFYPSDYGFASNGACLNTDLSDYSADCSNWLGSVVTNSAWTMMPSTYEENIYNGTRRTYASYYMFYLNANHNLGRNGIAYRGNNYYYRAYAVYPSFYLKNTLKITGGDGTQADPFIIGDSGDLLTDIIDDLAHPEAPSDDPYVPVDDDGNYQEGTDYQARTHIHLLGGDITGSVYGAGNNNGSGNGNTSGSRVANTKITIDMDGGNVHESIYGGSNEEGIVYGDVLININNGTITGNVYGGGKGGFESNNSPGTYVSRNVDVNIGNDNTTFLLISGNVYGGSAFGTVNGIAQNEYPNDNYVRVTVNKGTVSGSVFGGGEGDADHTPNEYGNIFVHIDGGNITKVFGGNDSKGTPSGSDVVYLNGGTVGDAFGGGNNTGQHFSDIRLQGSTVTGNVYGGSNASGDVDFTHVTVSSGSAAEVYGGNNLGGKAGDTFVNVSGGTISTAIYGGGKQADANATNVNITGCTVPDVYGGGKNASVDTGTKVDLTNATAGKVFGGSNAAGDVPISTVTVTGTTAAAVYGGNNSGGTTTTTNITAEGSTITNMFGGGDNASSTTSNILIKSGTVTNCYGGGNKASVTTTNVKVNGGSVTTLFGGSNELGDITDSNINVTGGSIGTMFGGNNLGGETTTVNIVATGGSISTTYGGGNKANVGSTTLDLKNITGNNVFGGGNEAPINGDVSLTIDNATLSGSVYGGGNAAGVTGDVFLDIDDSAITGSVYGGGNEGIVQSDTDVYVTSCTVGGNLYAGGNGATAIVYGNSTITVDGSTVVGSSNGEIPNTGCVFGSGNAASTGLSGSSKVATVNIVGGEFFGNVYGGAKMAVVNGVTDTNIGTSAVSKTGLEEGKIHIHGTVFGGGESNASGSEVYDYTFISVTEGIDINIDGTGYAGNNHDFIINGSIFGSGNASSSAGAATVNIKNLGSDSKPNRAVSIQRVTNLTIDHSVIELLGAKDRTNDLVDFEYSFNQIDKLIIKNDTTLYLQHNANLLKELYSGVDVGGTLQKATVDIDDSTKTVTRNVNNRIYMLPGENLHIAVNQAATAYGKVNGMTFYGMYTVGDNNNYRTGLYDKAYDYGDSGNASLELVGGSYAIGLRNTNHDITKDGFYTNTLDEATYTEIITKYINPSPIGDTGYRWIIGFEAINYTVPLTLSKYSTLGTYELSMIDFAQGNSIFTVLGFDSSGLESGVEIVDSNEVPRIAPTEEEANGTIGLSMKIETQEWTSSGTTKFYSADGGDFKGGNEYTTDSRQVAPSAMFYAYHAKNFSRTSGDMGECVITMQVAVPKNQIEYDIKFLTITVEISARSHDEGTFYDASITYDKKYEMPAATDVFITNQSQFTTYFSLTDYFENFATAYGRNNEYYRVITFTNPLPEGTMITMMDLASNPNRPEYYYYRIDHSVYTASVTEWENYGEVAYRLSNFIKMDSTSTNNTYNDAASNLLYYNTDTNMTDEEFLFIIDMKDSKETGEHLNNKASFELRNSDNFAVINVVSGRDALMVYNTFESSNVVLSQNFNGVDSYLYYNVPDQFTYSTEILYNQTENRQSIIDTNYEYSNMGLNVVFYDRTGEPVSSSLLLGTSVSIGNHEYFADGEGVFRIKLASKVSNIEKASNLVIGKNLPAGTYTVRYTLFASEDGLHNSTYQNSVYKEFEVIVVSSSSYIAVDCDDEAKLVYGETGLNHDNTKINTYTVSYVSELNNPNFRVEVFKRSTDNINSTIYQSVPFNTLFKNNFTTVSGNEKSLPVTKEGEQSFDFELADDLTSGTYKVVFKLYDNNQLIDEDTKNVIVQKKIP